MEVTDAYQAYLQTRRENEERDKIATLTLTQTEMASIWKVVAGAVDDAKEALDEELVRRWNRILRSLQTAIQEAT